MVSAADVPYLRQQTVTNPAAGADWTYTCPGQGIQRIIALRALFAASAAAANRIPTLNVGDGTDTFAVTQPGVAVTANQTVAVSTYPGAPPNTVASSLVTFASPTDGWLLLPGWRISMATNAIDVGDQWTVIKLWVVEYPTGPQWRHTPDVYTFMEPKG